ncbi:hypothetical protein BDZ45DRAFT_699308 [Acephala macrosclerotiorum]|nr:hypothetical protein BDZ45DRAFT_699308 [Acephala macrosclerotiorum]
MQRDRARVRPDPVSCQSCRSKKIKCNRVHPYSNCTARSIICNFLVPPQVQSNTTSTNAELRARIERLESILLKQSSSTETQISDENSPTQQYLHLSSESELVANDKQKRDRELRLLQNIGTREDSLTNASDLNLRRPVDEGTVVEFPVYKIATLLLESYESNFDHLCCILYTPSVQSLTKTVYLRLNQNKSVLPGQAALLLSIFALSAYFYQPFDVSEVAATKRDAIHLSKYLSRGALDVLDYSRRNALGTLEDVQASILMSYVSYHLDGFSARGRLLSTAAVSMARELRLHRLDADNESSTTSDQSSIRDMIDRELKRRVFWHVVSTDWLLSTTSGPQEGTYFMHPNHINVNLPKDCIDDDLILGEENSGSHPTRMSYFLHRLRLAHLSREIADTIPLDTTKLLQLPYSQIISLDKKLQDYLSSLPFFFKLDSESRKRSIPLEIIYPKIPISRYCTSIEAHSRRFKLHQRFLLRQLVNPQYAYSRRACLESARAVVNAYEDLREHYSVSTRPDLMGIAVHFTHLALVTMVMDLCFNKEEGDEEGMKAEVKAALEMFEDSRHASPLLGRFLSSLSDVLLKRKVQLTDSSTTANNGVTNADIAEEMMLDHSSMNELSYEDQMQFHQFGLDMENPNIILDASASFDEFWQNAMQGEPNLDSNAWDDLFSGLNSRPI